MIEYQIVLSISIMRLNELVNNQQIPLNRGIILKGISLILLTLTKSCGDSHIEYHLGHGYYLSNTLAYYYMWLGHDGYWIVDG